MRVKLRRTSYLAKTVLKEKQKFKVYFKFKTEKKFKEFYRFCLNLRRPSFVFNTLLQRRLDYMLVFSNFFPNYDLARTAIRQGFIKVNGFVTTHSDYYIQRGDIIQIDYKIKQVVYKNMIRSLRKKKLFAKNFYINFKSLEIYILGFFTEQDLKIGSTIGFNFVKRAHRR
jgi:ribosomal protein S4